MRVLARVCSRMEGQGTHRDICRNAEADVSRAGYVAILPAERPQNRVEADSVTNACMSSNFREFMKLREAAADERQRHNPPSGLLPAEIPAAAGEGGQHVPGEEPR